MQKKRIQPIAQLGNRTHARKKSQKKKIKIKIPHTTKTYNNNTIFFISPKMSISVFCTMTCIYVSITPGYSYYYCNYAIYYILQRFYYLTD